MREQPDRQLTPEQVEARERCACGSVAAQQDGKESWLRLDVVCPVCDVGTLLPSLLDLNSDEWEESADLTLDDLREFVGWILDNPGALTRDVRLGAILRGAQLYAGEYMRQWNISNNDD